MRDLNEQWIKRTQPQNSNKWISFKFQISILFFFYFFFVKSFLNKSKVCNMCTWWSTKKKKRRKNRFDKFRLSFECENRNRFWNQNNCNDDDDHYNKLKWVDFKSVFDKRLYPTYSNFGHSSCRCCCCCCCCFICWGINILHVELNRNPWGWFRFYVTSKYNGNNNKNIHAHI